MILKVCEWLPGPITQQYSTYKTYVKYVKHVKLYPIVRESRWAEDISFNWHAGEFPDGTSGRPETPEIPFLFGTNGPNDTSLSQEILKWHNMNKGDQRITILHEQKRQHVNGSWRVCVFSFEQLPHVASFNHCRLQYHTGSLGCQGPVGANQGGSDWHDDMATPVPNGWLEI